MNWRTVTFPVVVAVGLLCAAPAASSPSATGSSHVALQATASASEVPGVAWRPIPYGAKRQAQMARYARLHYGVNSARLRDVRQIVLHFTVSSTVASAWNQFASNARAHQPTGGYSYPGTCAHFIVGKDGSVYQLVPLSLMCRHTVGLNDQTIGIEFVEERSPARILARPAQVAGGARLVRYLMGRYGIARGDVIGHAMANQSRFFTERQKGWRNTHTDWRSADVARFRSRL